MTIVHHHLIYQAHVGNDELGANSEKVLEKFLYDLLDEIGMKCLIQAQAADRPLKSRRACS